MKGMGKWQASDHINTDHDDQPMDLGVPDF